MKYQVKGIPASLKDMPQVKKALMAAETVETISERDDWVILPLEHNIAYLSVAVYIGRLIIIHKIFTYQFTLHMPRLLIISADENAFFIAFNHTFVHRAVKEYNGHIPSACKVNNMLRRVV